MSKFRRARNPYVEIRPWSRDQLQRLDRERQALLDEARAGSRQAHAALKRRLTQAGE